LVEAALRMLSEKGREYQRLEDIRPPVFGAADPYFAIKFRVQLQQRVRANHELCEHYERLVKHIIAPHLLDSLEPDERTALSSFDESSKQWNFEILYQYPPTMR
jgi:hypothetical protein